VRNVLTVRWSDLMIYIRILAARYDPLYKGVTSSGPPQPTFPTRSASSGPHGRAENGQHVQMMNTGAAVETAVRDILSILKSIAASNSLDTNHIARATDEVRKAQAKDPDFSQEVWKQLITELQQDKALLNEYRSSPRATQFSFPCILRPLDVQSLVGYGGRREQDLIAASLAPLRVCLSDDLLSTNRPTHACAVCM
jgi:hypothetical protein